MAWKRFDNSLFKGVHTVKPIVTVTERGQFSFNAAAIRGSNLFLNKAVELYFDTDMNRVGLKFKSGGSGAKLCVNDRPQARLSATEFIRVYRIKPGKYELKEIGNMIIFEPDRGE